jgi:N-sulfoglucosamine sulfohydrolase
MPTILEAAGLPPVPGIDGRSFLPVLEGEARGARDSVFTVFNTTSARRDYPMRCLQNQRFGYIFNAWSDGETVFRNESQHGLTMNAMRRGAEVDPEVAKRVNMFLYRVPEEFYDFAADPDGLENLIDRREYRGQIATMRKGLLAEMIATRDPLAETFRERVNVE